jgi:hypothetical protein
LANVIFALATILLVAVFLRPSAAGAQADAQSELKATIRAELLSDPRTSGLSETDLNAMVEALTQEAQKQGLTSQDITWRPANTAAAATPSDTCGNIPAPLCALNRSFGFAGSDSRIPVWLGIIAALLVLITGIALEVRHRSGAPIAVP